MQKLIRVEWMKVRSYTAFWVMLLLFVVGVVGLSFIVFEVAKANDNQNTHQLLGSPFDFPDVWQTISWLSGWILFIPGILIITLMTNEYTYKTHRQNIIDGWSRMEFITVKWVWVKGFSFLAAVLAFLTALFFGLAGHTPFSATGMINILWLFLESLSYMALALLTGVLIRRAGLAIVLYFLYLFILKYLLARYTNRIMPGHVGEYFPLTISDDLIPFPFLKSAKDSIKGMSVELPPVFALVIGSILWPVIMYWLMLLRFRKSDL